MCIFTYMKKTIYFFKAISDSTRFKLFKLLQEQTYCVCELTEAMELSQPTISRQLKILEDAGIIEYKRNGQRVEYSLSQINGELGDIIKTLTKTEENNPEIIKLREKVKKACEKKS